MKTDKNFKLSKTAKRYLGSITDKATRRHFLNMMIDAEVSKEKNKNAKIKEDKPGQREVPKG